MRAIELEIEDVAFGGKGVGRSDGKAVFVPYTIEGERVSARITREKKQFTEAELERVLNVSTKRTTPECPYFGRCGGCSYQHIEYAHQLALKGRQVAQALRRIGHLADPPMQPIVPSPKPYAYRNRITVHADRGVVGYYRRDVHELIDVESCPIAKPEVNQALGELRARQPREGHFTLRMHPGPRVFTQTNDEVADELVRLIESFFPSGHHLLIDAFCGAGFFTKHLVHKFDRLIGIEWDQFAIAAAEATATEKENYIAGDVEIELARSLAGVDLETTCLLLDPPATGLSPATRQILAEHPVHTLVYVSCNPATLARDLRELETAFKIMSVTPLDMFPQTAEIEVAVHMQTRRPTG